MFEISQIELEKRRARCGELIKGLEQREMHLQTHCNVCGSRQKAILADRDRYGLPIRTAMCLNCGLIYLADRPSAEDYTDFYATGTYRVLTSGFVGIHPSIESIQRDQFQYASQLIRALTGHVPRDQQRCLLDVGGSAGIIAKRVAEYFGLHATVLDPAAKEINAARAAGLEGIVGSLESFKGSNRFDLILLCRSLEHLFDLRGSLLKIRDLLRPGGLLYCDIIDFVECCRLRGTPQAISKIDHCYWLCQESAPRIFRSIGLQAVSVNVSSDPECLGYLLESCDPVPLTASNEFAVHRILRQLREIDQDWRKEVSPLQILTHKVRKTFYGVRRSAYRSLRAAQRWMPSMSPVFKPKKNMSDVSRHPD
jgi:SAM-dependent methyltransferase